MKNIIERARKYIGKCPPAIENQHGSNATFYVAAILVWGFGLSEADALMLLHEHNRSCVPPWSEEELKHKVTSATGAKHDKPRGHLLKSGEQSGEWGVSGKGKVRGKKSVVAEPVRKPVFRPMVLKRVAAGAGLIPDVVEFLGARSLVRPDRQDSASGLRHLYLPGSGEKVIIFSTMKSQGQFVWKADDADRIQNRHLPSGPDGVWFLAQPVDGKFHPNPRMEGKSSRRSEESVTAWRYVGLESDEADPDDWVRCLVQMPLRISCICESGGRSIHALARVDAASKADWDLKVSSIKPALVTLGADPGAMSAVRLTRLPQAQRGQRVQRLLYLNPAPDGTPILRQPVQAALYQRGQEGSHE